MGRGRVTEGEKPLQPSVDNFLKNLKKGVGDGNGSVFLRVRFRNKNREVVGPFGRLGSFLQEGIESFQQQINVAR